MKQSILELLTEQSIFPTKEGNQEIERLSSDLSNLYECQNLFILSDVNYKVKYLLSSLMYNILNKYCDRMDERASNDFEDWIFNTIESEKQIFLDHQEIIVGFSKLYSVITCKLYECNDVFNQFYLRLEQFEGNDLRNTFIVLNLMISIVEEFNKSEKFNLIFFNKELSRIMKFSIDVLIKIYSQDLFDCVSDSLILVSLKLMDQCFSYQTITYVKHSNYKEDEIKIFTVNVPIDFSEVIENPQFIYLLFQYYYKMPKLRYLCLDILFKLASTNHSCFINYFKNNSIQIIYKYFIDNLCNIFQNQMFEETEIHLLCIISYKIQIYFTMETKLMENIKKYYSFIDLFYQFTLNILSIDFLLSNPQSVFYSILFWTRFLDSFFQIPSVKIRNHIHDLIVQICMKYFNLIIIGFTEYFQDVYLFFTKDDRYFYEQFRYVSILSEIDFQYFTNYFLSTIDTFKQQYISTYSYKDEIKLSIVIQIIVFMLISNQSTKFPDLIEQEISLFLTLYKLIQEPIIDINYYKSMHQENNLFFEEEIITFCFNFSSTVFGVDSFKSREHYLKIRKSQSNFNELDFSVASKQIFQRIILSLKTFDNSPVLIHKIVHLLEIVNIGIRNLDIDEETMKTFLFSDYSFLRKADQDCRINFLKLIYQKIFETKWKKEIPNLLDNFSNKIKKSFISKDIIGLSENLIDLSALFSVAIEKEDYLILFHWFFPSKLKIIEENLNQLINFSSFISSFFIFWKSFTESKGRRIVFDDFSPNGILLFKSSANIFTKYLNILKENTTSLNFSEYLSTFKLLLMNLNCIFDNNYVVFDAFLIYKDTVLIDLLTLFFETIQKIEIHTIYCYPECAYSFTQFLKTLISKHFNIIITLQAEFMELILYSIEYSIFSPNCNFDSLGFNSVYLFYTNIIKYVEFKYENIFKPTKELFLRLFQIVLNRTNEESRRITLAANPLKSILSYNFSLFSSLKIDFNSDNLNNEFSELKYELERTITTINERRMVTLLDNFGISVSKIPYEICIIPPITL